MNRIRQHILRKVHLWIGGVAGVFIAIIGLSGFIIVFRPIIESAAAPRVTGPAVVNLALVERSLAAAHPGAVISRVIFPESSSEPVLVQAQVTDQQRLQEFFDGSSGQDLGAKKTLAWLEWIVDLHQNLLMGKTGRALTGVIGVALLFLSLSGLLSWLSGQRDWKRALAVPRPSSWRAFVYRGHKWAGLWANVFLITVSFTGIVLAYPDSFQHASRAISGEPQPVKSAGRGNHRSTEPLLPLDAYVQAATASLPRGVVRELRMPSRGRFVVSVAMRAPGDLRPKGGTTVLLDPSSAAFLSIERSSVGLVDLANAIHKTELGGLPVKLPWSLLGFTPVLLFVSGVQIWWSKRTAALRTKGKDGAEESAGSASRLVHK